MSAPDVASQSDVSPAPAPLPPVRWPWQMKQLGNSFWSLYASSCLIDFGLCLYFFMFSLFMVEHNFTVQSIGYITAALTIGMIAGTVPASFLSRKLGLRTMMLLYVLATPLSLALRVCFLQIPLQIGLAFLSGLMMSIGSVCFSPTIAKLTTQENRTFGFSLFIATGISSGAVAGMLGGYLPGLVRRLQWGGPQVDGIKLVLLLACSIMLLAVFAMHRLRVNPDETVPTHTRIISRFLVRFLLSIGIWNFAIGFFIPFANVYLSRQLGLPLMRIGEIFTISQLFQVAMVLLAPILYRKVGLVAGLALTQIGTALLLCSLSRASGGSIAIGIYVLLTGLQWMGGPGISSLLMNRTAEAHRSQATAMQSVVNLAAQAGSAALAGKMFGLYGYSGPLAADSALAACAAVLLYTLLGREDSRHRTR